MAMYVKSNYDGFVCTVQVTSDTIDEIDLTAPDFRIDIVNQFEAADNAQQIAMLLEQKATEEQKRDLRDDIEIPPNDPIYQNKKTGEWVTTQAAYELSGGGPWTYAGLSALYDDRIAALHYASQDAADLINQQVAGISYTMDQANSAVDACENGTSGKRGIKDYIADTSNPMLSITCNGSQTYETSSTSGVHGIVKSDVFANTDDETLIRNGMQYWVSKDKKSLTFRFIPQVNAEYKFQSVVVVCALDYQNIARFEVCLMPRLITGDLEKCTDTDPLGLNPPTTDPIVPVHARAISSINPQTQEVEWQTIEDDYRPDYVFNDDTVDNDHLFVNNTPWTTASDPAYPQKTTESLTPLYQLKSSAYITDDIVGSGYTYNWGKFKSEIYDFGALSSMPIPFKIGVNEVTATGVDPTPKTATIQLVPSYTGHDEELEALNTVNVNVYEITQYIETSANVPKFSQNQVRVTVAI
jgi:hypothetical protein